MLVVAAGGGVVVVERGRREEACYSDDSCLVTSLCGEGGMDLMNAVVQLTRPEVVAQTYDRIAIVHVLLILKVVLAVLIEAWVAVVHAPRISGLGAAWGKAPPALVPVCRPMSSPPSLVERHCFQHRLMVAAADIPNVRTRQIPLAMT